MGSHWCLRLNLDLDCVEGVLDELAHETGDHACATCVRYADYRGDPSPAQTRV